MTYTNLDQLMWERVVDDEFAVRMIREQTAEVIAMLERHNETLKIGYDVIEIIRARMAAAYIAGGSSGQFALTISGNTEGKPNTLRYWLDSTSGTYDSAVQALNAAEEARREAEFREKYPDAPYPTARRITS